MIGETRSYQHHHPNRSSVYRVYEFVLFSMCKSDFVLLYKGVYMSCVLYSREKMIHSYKVQVPGKSTQGRPQLIVTDSLTDCKYIYERFHE